MYIYIYVEKDIAIAFLGFFFKEHNFLFLSSLFKTVAVAAINSDPSPPAGETQL